MEEIAMIQENIEELGKKLKRESVAYQHASDNGNFAETKRIYNLIKISLVRIQMAIGNLKSSIDLNQSDVQEREKKNL